jgi:D-lactate dehydrogenase
VTAEAPGLIERLQGIVGAQRVLVGEAQTAPYRTGYRWGAGAALAVVCPRRLVDLWHVAQACVDAGVIIIMQSANTGLTGGSTPNGADYDRPVVIVSTTGIAGIHPINGGRQVVCLPGATLYELESMLEGLGREPHSVIGSSCIGASVMGGICNNSGGALVQRGPAFTELALYGQLGADGVLRLVNHLGIQLDGTPEAVLEQVERGDFPTDAIDAAAGRGSDDRYLSHVREVDSPVPARFNADPRCLFEASGSAGRLILFAVRLDTFAKAEDATTFYIGANDPDDLANLRRHMLAQFKTLPVSAEYIHRDAFNIAERYGKDTFLAIRWLGTARLPRLFAAKARMDRMMARAGFDAGFADRWLQRFSRLWPSHLPPRMKEWRDRFEHHLLLKMAGDGVAEARAYLTSMNSAGSLGSFECTPDEAGKAFLHRFAVAGAAIRYRQVHGGSTAEIVALDIALPRNCREWVERLPEAIDRQIVHKLYYGHFFCHVFHQDYIVRPGVDGVALEHELWALLDARGAEYPAEHNVGHLYPAKPQLAGFYRELDPTNSFNPGIGQTSKAKGWGGGAVTL